MPAGADEIGTKLISLLDMFGRELLRSKINESTRLSQEAKEAKAAAKGLSNRGKGMRKQDYTTTWFDSPAEAQQTLRELKQISPKLFANSTVVGHFLVHPKDGMGKDGKRSHVIQDAIYDISREHRYAARIIDLYRIEKSKSDKGYIKSLPDGDCTRFSFGEFGNEGASLNAAYFCSVLQDYDINARHVGNQVILNKADADRGMQILDLEKQKVEAMGPERGEMFMRQRFMDRLGVEYEPPMIEENPDDRDDADEMLSRETRKAELHEDISNSKTTADCVQARPDTHNGDLSTPYADGQDAPGTGDSDGDGIRDAAEDRDGDGVPDKHDRDAEYIDDDPDYEPVSMKERTVDELMSDKTEEAAFVASRSAAQAEKDVSLETVNR